MTEAQFTTKLFAQWRPNKTTAIEVKFVKSNTFNVKQWLTKQGHQYIALTNSTTDKGVLHKISDQSSGIKPYDAFFICNSDAVLVLWFDKYKEYFIIPVQDIPTDQTSISYSWCKERFNGHRLLSKKISKVIDF